MYQPTNKQLSFDDFNMPLGLKLDPSNRWVKRANLIPWEELENLYAGLFVSELGNTAKPFRLAFGALIIQRSRNTSDEETALQILETPCLQYFCGLPGYTDKAPFEASSMVHFRKRIELIGLDINEHLIENFQDLLAKMKAEKAEQEAKPSSNENEEPPSNPPSNAGELVIDATCAPQNIRFPQDVSLLNEARENLESMIDHLHWHAPDMFGGKPRAYRENARRDYLDFAKSKKRSIKKIRKAVRKQLNYVRRDLGIVSAYLAQGMSLPKKLDERLSTIHILYSQQKHMYDSRENRVADRIVSLSQPWVRPIVRGKMKAKCEFGAKIDLSVSDGFARLEHSSFDAYNESENLMAIVERYKERNGFYPEKLLADKIYRTRKNIEFCQSRNIRLIGKPLGRPKNDCVFDERQNRRDEIDRIEVERKFSEAKGSFGMGLVKTKLKETSLAAIGLAVMLLNIALMERIFHIYFWKRIFAKFNHMNCYGKFIIYGNCRIIQ